MDKIKSAMLKAYGMVRVDHVPPVWKLSAPMPFTGGDLTSMWNCPDRATAADAAIGIRAMLALEILGEPASNEIEDHCLNAPGDAEQRVRAWFEAKLDPIEQLAGANPWRGE